jgi:hypothetical protein
MTLDLVSFNLGSKILDIASNTSSYQRPRLLNFQVKLRVKHRLMSGNLKLRVYLENYEWAKQIQGV